MTTSQHHPATEVEYGHQDVFDNSKPFYVYIDALVIREKGETKE
jgi:hypothetical protein